MTSDYRLAAHVAVRMMGATVAAAGLLVVLVAVLVGAFSWPRAVLSTALVLAVLLVVGGGLLLLRRTTVVRLDDEGYRVRFVRGVGVAQGRWKDVEDVVASTVGGARCVVLRRRDGTTTTIPVNLVERGETTFVQDLQQHLNRGHGYRSV
jgi:hypothetical protein